MPSIADERREAFDRRIAQNHFCQSLLALRHGGEGDILRRLRDAKDQPSVLHREEALRNDHEQKDRYHQRGKSDEQRRWLALKNPLQRSAIFGDHPVERVLGFAIEPGLLVLRACA